MTLDALFDTVIECVSDAENIKADIRLLLERIPPSYYAAFLDFYRRHLHERNDLAHLAENVRQFNDTLVESGMMEEVIADLESKLAELAPTLLDLGFLSAKPPRMTWAVIQNHYRLVVDNRMLLFDFTKTEFELIQAIKLDRAVRLVHRDAGEFAPYARHCIASLS